VKEMNKKEMQEDEGEGDEEEVKVSFR